MPKLLHAVLAVLCASWTLAGSNAWAAQRGTSATGVDHVSGGVGQDEQQALLAERGDYSFWLTTAVRKSGAHLSGVLVRIREAETGLLVLDHRMDGPWLFARLPVGQYEIDATLQDLRLGRIEVQRGTTTIHPNDRHQLLLYFDTGEAIGERAPGATPPNPYGGDLPVRKP
ncbi:hypothetical protein [uncultured Piscinibacter sp.]|uniref:hypothetical protein n=1 Tax=uncultured Piscinibacter sp. TaxID=1131835 RepID=UPI002632EE7C|nr:hypothetical protein [uncultured Piscinibacter sp.]